MVGAGACPKAGAQEQEGRVKNGITFDTGALIALERRGQRARKVLERATEQKVRITVPAPVITEWWRSRNDIRERILAGVRVEALSESIRRSPAKHWQLSRARRRSTRSSWPPPRSGETSSTLQTFRTSQSWPVIFGQCACWASADTQPGSLHCSRALGAATGSRGHV